MSTIKVDTVRPVTTDADLALQGDASGSGVTGAKVFGDGSLGADSITDLAGTGAPDFPNGLSSSKTMSNFGIIETLAAGGPLIGSSAYQDFTYTAGEEYFVLVFCVTPATSDKFEEVYRINSDNTVSEIYNATGSITPTIPSSGTLRITNGSGQNVILVQMIRMDW